MRPAFCSSVLFSYITFGVKLDTNFKGGTIYTYSFNGEMGEDGVKAIAADVLKTDASVAFSKELTGSSSQVATITTNVNLLPRCSPIPTRPVRVPRQR